MDPINPLADDSLLTMDDDDDDTKVADDEPKVDDTQTLNVGSSNLKELYDSLDIDVNNRSNRLNAVHIRGVNEMSAEDIAEYFPDLKFDSIEWIDDNSCNVVWGDEVMAAKAIASKNKSIIKRDKQVFRANNEELEDGIILSSDDEEKKIISSNGENVEDDDAKNLGIPVPPGKWVVGFPHEKSRGILMRFALKSDRKVPGAEKRSQYYLKHGNPNYGGMVGLISKSKKRSYREIFTVKPGPEEPEPVEPVEVYETEPRSVNKMPKMRMYADEETQKKRQKQCVSEERPPVGDLRNKLSSRTRVVVAYDEPREREDAKSSGDLRAKLKGRAKPRPEVDDDDDDSEDESDLRRKLNQMRRRKRNPENLIIELAN